MLLYKCSGCLVFIRHIGLTEQIRVERGSRRDGRKLDWDTIREGRQVTRRPSSWQGLVRNMLEFSLPCRHQQSDLGLGKWSAQVAHREPRLHDDMSGGMDVVQQELTRFETARGRR